MRLFTIIGVIFYSMILFFAGGLIIAFSLHWINSYDLIIFLDYIYQNLNSRLIAGLVGLLLILISISFAQIILGKIQRERTIAFNNPSGQVTVALSAVEDLLRRLGVTISEIKELRPDVIAGKKGLEIDLKVVLRSEANIPALTSRLQEIVRSKVQEILGIEELITVRIHVTKIVLPEEKEKKKREQDLEDTIMPYQDYGRA